MANPNPAANGGTKYKSSDKWVILAFVCLFFYLINGFIYTSFNVLVRTMAIDLGWTDAERAVVVSGLSTGMIWFIFVAGVALDKFSPKKLLSLFAIFAAVAVVLRGRVTKAGPFFILMFIYGALVAFIIPALNKLNGLWFDKKNIALANGFLTAASPLGQITGNIFAVPISEALGSTSALFTMQGIMLAAVAVLFLFLGKERRNIDAALSSTKITSEKDLGVWKNFKAVISVPQVWLYALANACLLGMVYAGGSQGQIVLQGDPNWMLDSSISGIVPSCNNFASMCCYILMPLVVAKFFKKNYEKNYKLFAIITGVIAAFCYSYGYRCYNFTLICILMLISGVAYGSCIPAPKVLLLKLPDVSGPRAGTAMGIYLTVERAAQAIMTGAIGGFMAMHPDSMAETLSNFWLIMLGSPVLIIISIFFDKRDAKRAAAAAAS